MKPRCLIPHALAGVLSLLPARTSWALPSNPSPAQAAPSEAVPSEAGQSKAAAPEADPSEAGVPEAGPSETAPQAIIEPPLPDQRAALARAEREKARREKHDRKRAERAKARQEKTERKRARRERAKHEHRIPLRFGAGALAGGTLPNAAPALGFALRAGIQRTRVSFMLEGGLLGAVGGAQSSGDRQSSRATIFYHGYLAPTAELNWDPLFVSLGVPLGIGMWSSTSNTVDPSGTVLAETRSTGGLVTFVGGLDARLGRHFSLRGRHHFTCAIGTKLLLARQDEASTVIPLQGAIEGTSDRTLGVRLVPTLSLGYDFF